MSVTTVLGRVGLGDGRRSHRMTAHDLCSDHVLPVAHELAQQDGGSGRAPTLREGEEEEEDEDDWETSTDNGWELSCAFVLDFGELRLAHAIESSAQGCGWRLRFDVESKLSSVTKTFVVKDSEFRDCGDSGITRGGKVNSTCCCVHKNAELVQDNAGVRMYVRTTRQMWADSEILVMYHPASFGGVQGRCRF